MLINWDKFINVHLDALHDRGVAPGEDARCALGQAARQGGPQTNINSADSGCNVAADHAAGNRESGDISNIGVSYTLHCTRGD